MATLDSFAISNATKALVEDAGKVVKVPAGKTVEVTFDTEETATLADLIGQGCVVAPGSLTNVTSQVADETADVITAVNLVQKGAHLLLDTERIVISSGADAHAKSGL